MCSKDEETKDDKELKQEEDNQYDGKKFNREVIV